MGGSQGAKAVNSVILASLERLTKAGIEIRHQTGSFDLERVLAGYRAHGVDASGVTPFIAKIDPQNIGSQKMFRRLGFVPWGIDTHFINDPAILEGFEEERLEELGGIPEELCSLAEEFGVEPRKLLSHVLVFRHPAHMPR